MPSRGMIAVATIKRVESRIADRRFLLQTVVLSRLSAAAGPVNQQS
jgi:hypothetical protein